jgi:hypothetical protein
MSTQFICDRSGSALGKAKRTPGGGYRVPAVVARVGVLEYPNPDGSVLREYTPASVLRAAADGLADAPVTNLHPPVHATPQGPLVTADNASTYRRGFVAGPVAFDGNLLTADLVIDSADLIQAIEGGRREVSLGYLRELDFTPGLTPDGAPYDAIRVKITANHVAIVDTARAGRQARLVLDHAKEPRDWERPLVLSKSAPKADATPAADAGLKPWQRPLRHSK